MIASIFLLATQIGGPSEPRRLFAAGDKDVVMMLPQETVCGSEVGQMVWNAAGTHLVAARGVVDLTAEDVAAMVGATRPSPEATQRLRPRTELVVWSLKTRKAQTVQTTDAQRAGITDLTPLPGSDRVIVQMMAFSTSAEGVPTSTERIAILTPALGKLTVVADFPTEQAPVFQVSDTRPLAALVHTDPKTRASDARFFGPAGVLGQPVPIPPGGNFMFDRSGRPSFVTNVRKPDGKRQILVHQIDPASGRELSVVPFDPAEAKDVPPHLNLVAVAGRAEDANAPSIFLKVEGGKKGEEGVVTTDGSRGLLSPKGDAVAYLSQGGAMVRRFAHVDRKAYEAAQAAALRTVALSNAKQAALALLMYAADTDDNYPSPGDYGKIEPYLKNSSIMNSFTYTFGGGNAVDIEKPAETEIGYVPGPGGRAVAYADGHVKWIPDAP